MKTDQAHHEEIKQFFTIFNKIFQANLAKISMGISPAAIGSAYCAWILQLAQSPGHLLDLTFYPLMHLTDSITHMLCEEHAANGRDVRFCNHSWQWMPWRFYAESFVQMEDWWRHATTGVPGLSTRVERTISFCSRQILDALSPSNFVWSNPELFNKTLQSGGVNLIQGTQIAFDNMLRRSAGLPPPRSRKFYTR